MSQPVFSQLNPFSWQEIPGPCLERFGIVAGVLDEHERLDEVVTIGAKHLESRLGQVLVDCRGEVVYVELPGRLLAPAQLALMTP